MASRALAANAPATLELALLRRDGGTQPRDSISIGIAKEYAEALLDGDILPPVTVFYDGTAYWLADGFHRSMAHELAEIPRVPVDIRQGSRRDAILYSVGANAAHGYRRSAADKRRAVLTLINDPEWSGWSDREIARRCAVDHKTVAAIRPAPTGEIPSERVRTYQKANGKQSTMRVGAIGQRKSSLPLVAGMVPSRRPDPSFGKAEVISLHEAARVIGFKPERLARLARAGTIPGAAKDGQSWYFNTEALRRWMKQPATPLEIEAEPGTAEATAIPAKTPEQDRIILNLVELIDGVSTWPTVDEAIAAWALFRGRAIDSKSVGSAAAWLTDFASRFPAVEAERQLAIAAMLEKVASHVAN